MKNKLPPININTDCYIYMTEDHGDLVYEYKPFYNLKLEEPSEYTDLGYLTLDASNAEVAINSPIDIDIEESYDGSANIIINDRINPLKIINSRFYLIDSLRYRLGDRKGNLDTNIYTEDNFKIETNLVKSVQSVVGLDFMGLLEGGKMPIGNYTFYFKLADSDGNESDFIAESGKVVCHIGNINQPHFIRGGQLNENSGKSIKFNLKNIDLAYNFINVYYTRTTGDNEQEVVTAHKIYDKFKVTGINTNITISGYEDVFDIAMDDINIKYSEFNSVKSTENCQNMTFAGGTTNDYELFELLEQYSLYVTPSIATDKTIGNLSHDYKERFDMVEGNEYYNADNIYYKLGYWDNEMYRLGIVYIMNDYTLSPEFNIRGITELGSTTKFSVLPDLGKPVNYDENFVIENTEGLENAKGVFKINSDLNIFNKSGNTTPLGIKINFSQDVMTGGGKTLGLRDVTKGFFIVRQKRIPTILAQAVGIGTTKKGHLPAIKTDEKTYIIESFLREVKRGNKSIPRLGSSYVSLTDEEIDSNALLCPEADLRTEVYNNYFDSSKYMLKESKYQLDADSQNFISSKDNSDHFYLSDLSYKASNDGGFNSSLLLVENGVELIKNNDKKFSSKAGEESLAHSHVDVIEGDYADPKTKISNKKDADRFNRNTSKIRGVFNTYIGSDSSSIKSCKYYDIYQTGYNFDKWRDYFKHRYNDASPFFPISDRMTYDDFKQGSSETDVLYRGDCYINTFTHKMHSNFIDHEYPTNKTLVDVYTWRKHFKLAHKVSVTLDDVGLPEEGSLALSYNKLLPSFTYKRVSIEEFSGDKNDSLDLDVDGKYEGVLDEEDKGYKKYASRNGTFGLTKLNRADINAVGLGHWVTYKICSNVNLAMRDVDLMNPTEEAMHGMKRSFYPLQSMDKDLVLPESRVLNKGISKTTGNRYYFEIPDVPFIRTHFPTRIFYSNILQQSSFVNGNRTFLAKNHQDYTMEYGSIIKLVEWYGTLMAIMEHGILQIPVNERAMMKNESGENVYINTDEVLPKNPKVLSNTYGSLWADSIITTDKYVYGLDTVAKKIWRTNGEGFEIISDLKIQTFLNDNINLKETDIVRDIGNNVIKTHFNAFKHDIIFTYKYGEDIWSICWNELLERWVTRYSWYPEFSENINNIFYTFANIKEHNKSIGKLYKHGFAGTLAEEGNIQPTKWYDEQHPFEFEFVVAPQPGIQKIYDNFEIVSNRVEPNSFIFELVGDGYDWGHLKKDILLINEVAFKEDPVEPEPVEPDPVEPDPVEPGGGIPPIYISPSVSLVSPAGQHAKPTVIYLPLGTPIGELVFKFNPGDAGTVTGVELHPGGSRPVNKTVPPNKSNVYVFNEEKQADTIPTYYTLWVFFDDGELKNDSLEVPHHKGRITRGQETFDIMVRANNK